MSTIPSDPFIVPDLAQSPIITYMHGRMYYYAGVTMVSHWLTGQLKYDGLMYASWNVALIINLLKVILILCL